jgi:hypothetical protein
MRTIINATSGAVVAPAGALTLYSDRAASSLVIGSLRTRGYRQLSLTLQNTAAITVTLFQAANPAQALTTYDTFTAPIYSSTNKNTYVWDLTSLGEVTLQLNSSTGDTITAVVEASEDVEALRSC